MSERKLIDLENQDNQEQNQEQNEQQTENSVINPIDTILDTFDNNKKAKTSKVQIAVYVDPEVHKKYLKFGNKYGKGAKSDLINELLKAALESKGF